MLKILLKNTKLLSLKVQYLWLLIFLFSSVNQSIISQEKNFYLLIENQSSNVSLSEHIKYLCSGEKDSINDILKKQADFSPYNSATVFDKKGVYWAKFVVKSGFAQNKELVIQIGNKRSSDFAEMYMFNSGDSLIKYAKSGQFVPGNQKDIHQEQGSKFSFMIEPRMSYSLYFRIKNISGFKPEFIIKVYDKPLFNNRLSLRNLVQGILQGALWIMFFYNLFIFVYSRDKVYLYYSLYIVGIALNFIIERGLFLEYIIPDFPLFEPYAFILATGLATISYFQFVRFFLNTKKYMLAWDIAHLWVVRINIFITAGLLAVLLISFNIPLSVSVSNYLNLIGLLYGFVFIWYLIKKDNILSRFFIAGALALAIGTFISLYFLIAKNPLSFDPKYFMNVGTIGEILIFSLGLGYRIRLIEKSKQKVQVELIEQLKQNDKLKEKVNRELEGKVKERTAEIEQQKEEILSQSENLKAANDILINQKREIEQKNEEITQQTGYLQKVLKGTTDSINYASRIQNVILPSENILKKYFSDHFIYYKPKEIVSGDFYWYRYIERQNKRYFALVAADSTGHGVPGSLVSMLGISLLNETVVRNEVNKASQVLEILREEVKSTFSQSEERLLTRDGIDMAFCMIDLDTLEMQYSGANRPLLLFKKNGQVIENDEFNGLIEFKPTKNPVGVYHKEHAFENHLIQFEKGDVIYLFSDGYTDQIGGLEGRKFYLKRFKELLAKIHTLPLNEQKQIIIQAHNDWINHKFHDDDSFKQVDDILVMGIRF